jgi:hypothetical protein
MITVRDNITPDLQKFLQRFADKRPILLAMGEKVEDIARDAIAQSQSKEKLEAALSRSHPKLRGLASLIPGLHIVSKSANSRADQIEKITGQKVKVISHRGGRSSKKDGKPVCSEITDLTENSVTITIPKLAANAVQQHREQIEAVAKAKIEEMLKKP